MKRAVGATGVAMLFLSSMIGAASPATSPGPLRFFKNYFVTGDYVAAGVGLRGTGVNGFAQADIDMRNTDIPDGVDVLAAFLYWETVDLQQNTGHLAGSQFRGHDISKL